MKTRNLDRIKIHKKSWAPAKKNDERKPAAGLDTETSEGAAFILGISTIDGERIYRIRTFRDFLEAIVQEGLEMTDNFFYNVTYDQNALIKLLPIANIYDLGEKEQTTMRYGDETAIILIIPGKLFSITFREREYAFYDISQFYGRQSLRKVAKKILGEDKGDVTDIARLSPEKYDKNDDYRREIDEYLKQDAKLCRLLAEKLVEQYKDFIIPKTYYSTAKFSEQFFLENHALPGYQISLPPTYAMKAALKAYNGGRFEVMKRGTFKNVYIYDIKSAYPYHNSRVPDPGHGYWLKSDAYDEKALISLLDVTAKGSSHISPLRHNTKDGRLLYPQGEKRLWINKREYETIKSYGYELIVHEAFHFYDDNPQYIFRWLSEFFELKEKVGKDHPYYGAIKTLINGFYGKTIATVQRRNRWGEHIRFYKAGRLFNPIIANEITANTRCQLLEAARPYQERIIAFATDSIMSIGPLPSVQTGDNLGDWALEHAGVTVTMVGSGVYFIHEKDVLHLRGFDKNMKIEELKKQGKEPVINFPMMKPRPLKKSVRTHQVATMNVFLPDPRRLDVDFDRKRKWPQKAGNLENLLHNTYDSEPFTINTDGYKEEVV